MKRSEILEAIEQVLKESFFYGHEVASERVLARIEELGMLPPTIIDLPKSYNRYEGTYGYPINEWEPEE